MNGIEKPSWIIKRVVRVAKRDIAVARRLAARRPDKYRVLGRDLLVNGRVS